MESLTVTSSLLVPTTSQPLTPAMLTVLWVIADELDRQRVPATVKEAVWLEIPTKHLRPESRTDNVWLRECLTRLNGLQIGGEYRAHPWGAVLIAEWHILEGGSLCRLLVPPAGVQALRLPETFAKIELEAAYKLQGPARRLYGALADKKRMGQKHWTYSLGELRRLFGVEEKKSYERWADFKRCVITPAVEQINDFGTVTVKTTLQKRGRSVSAVRFDWQWKTIDEARRTEEKNGQPAVEDHKDKTCNDPPLIVSETTAEEKAPKQIRTPAEKEKRRLELEKIRAELLREKSAS